LHTYTSTSAPVSTISDADLDLLLASIPQTFPKFGHRMLKGCLRGLGHCELLRTNYGEVRVPELVLCIQVFEFYHNSLLHNRA
jgi:hypothetical protein